MKAFNNKEVILGDRITSNIIKQKDGRRMSEGKLGAFVLFIFMVVSIAFLWAGCSKSVGQQNQDNIVKELKEGTGKSIDKVGGVELVGSGEFNGKESIIFKMNVGDGQVKRFLAYYGGHSRGDQYRIIQIN